MFVNQWRWSSTNLKWENGGWSRYSYDGNIVLGHLITSSVMAWFNGDGQVPTWNGRMGDGQGTNYDGKVATGKVYVQILWINFIVNLPLITCTVELPLITVIDELLLITVTVELPLITVTVIKATSDHSWWTRYSVIHLIAVTVTTSDRSIWPVITVTAELPLIIVTAELHLITITVELPLITITVELPLITITVELPLITLTVELRLIT